MFALEYVSTPNFGLPQESFDHTQTTEGKSHQLKVNGNTVRTPLERLDVEDISVSQSTTELKHNLWQTLNSTQGIEHHMIEEQSRMSRQLGKDREGGMETEKLSSRLAQNRLHNKSLTEHYTVQRGLDSPNHVCLFTSSGTKEKESDWWEPPLPAHTQKHEHSILFLVLWTNSSVPQYFLNLQLHTRLDRRLLTFILMFLLFHTLTLLLTLTYIHLLSKALCITQHSQNNPLTSSPPSPPRLLLRFPRPNPVHPAPEGKQVNTYSSQLRLKTDTRQDARTVYVSLSSSLSLSRSPLPSFLRLLSQTSESNTGTKIADRPEFLQQI